MNTAGVVFDVNVYLHALTSHDRLGDASIAALRTALGDPRFEVHASEHILDEIYYKLVEHYDVPEAVAGETVAELEEMILETGTVLDPKTTLTDYNVDREDSEILALVRESGSSILVTHDEAHLLPMKVWNGRPVITADHFVQRARMPGATKSVPVTERLNQLASTVRTSAEPVIDGPRF